MSGPFSLRRIASLLRRGDTKRPGLRLTASALLVYGVSAGLSSASAGLFVVSLELYRGGNPVTGAFNVAGK